MNKLYDELPHSLKRFSESAFVTTVTLAIATLILSALGYEVAAKVGLFWYIGAGIYCLLIYTPDYDTIGAELYKDYVSSGARETFHKWLDENHGEIRKKKDVNTSYFESLHRED